MACKYCGFGKSDICWACLTEMEENQDLERAHRRLDAYARIILWNFKKTQCVAVAHVGDTLYVCANDTRTLSAEGVATLLGNVHTKKPPAYDKEKKQKAIEAWDQDDPRWKKLFGPETGGYASLEEYKQERINIDLNKVHAWWNKGYQFRTIMVLPALKKMHAEVRLLSYLVGNIDLSNALDLYLGVSYLCCRWCSALFDSYNSAAARLSILLRTPTVGTRGRHPGIPENAWTSVVPESNFQISKSALFWKQVREGWKPTSKKAEPILFGHIMEDVPSDSDEDSD
ncbi:hypothetical protein D7V80_27530 [Corallococcus sp. CA054B]|uniref:hypothetical protein n=1 Tax=Corallococcus sp. CA054B TaxID=2316734 RepID=UPI000EA3105B|nr:hypothetical protein [Corallococcus sp. CA054B]RKG64297.1 hypothetical protein D7V80_27530 [Corallococcus sp. CA054B]